MNLKMRPMNEAPTGQWLLTRMVEGQDGKFALFRDCGGGAYPPQLHYRRVEVKP